jgi:hypothetical protein
MTLIVLDTFTKVALFCLLICICAVTLNWIVESIEYRFGQGPALIANFLITATISFTVVISALRLGLIR